MAQDTPELTAEALTEWLEQHKDKLRPDQALTIRHGIMELKTMSQKEAAHSPALRRGYIRQMSAVLDVLTGFKSQDQ